MGSGSNPGDNSCEKSSAVVLGLDECPNEFVSYSCILVKNQGKLYDLSRKTTSASEAQSLMEAEMDIEGSGWGVRASTSAKYMSNNLKTGKTVTFWTSYHGDAYTTAIHNAAKLMLKNDAALFLKTDPQGFIDQFGSHYVQQISYSTSFHASTSFTETKPCDGSAYDAAMSASYQDYASGSSITSLNLDCDSVTTIESNYEYNGEGT